MANFDPKFNFPAHNFGAQNAPKDFIDFATPYRNGDLKTLVSCVSLIEQALRLGKDVLPKNFSLTDLYFSTSILAAKKKSVPRLIEFSLKAIKTASNGKTTSDGHPVNIRREVVVNLLEFVRSSPVIDERDKRAFGTLFTEVLTPETVRQMPTDEIVAWFGLVSSCFSDLPRDIFDRVSFCLSKEYVLRPDAQDANKAICSMQICNLSFYRAVYGESVDKNLIRESAERVLGRLKDVRPDKNDAPFAEFTLILLYFGLNDIADRVLEQLPFDAAHPIFECMRYIKEIGKAPAGSIPSLLYEIFQFRLKLQRENSSEQRIFGELLLMVLSKRFHSDSEWVSSTMAWVDPYQHLQKITRKDHPEILKQMGALRASYLRVYERTFPPGALNFDWGESGLLLYNGAQGFVDHIFCSRADQKFYKITYKASSSKDGRSFSILPLPFFARIPEKKSGEVPLFLEYESLWNLRNMAYARVNGKKDLGDELANLERLVGDLIQLTMSEGLRQGYDELSKSFSENPLQHGGSLFDLEDREHLGKKAKRLVNAVNPGIYQLAEGDLLERFIDRVEIDSESTTKRKLRSFNIKLILMGENRPSKHHFSVTFVPKNRGKEITAVMFENGEMKILGLEDDQNSVGEADKLLQRYLSQLALEAALHLSANGLVNGKNGNGKTSSTNGSRAFPAKGLNFLEGILYKKFYASIRERGAMVLPWYTYSEEKKVYLPIDDTTPEGKNKAFGEKGPGKIWVQKEPHGKIARLPVRSKKKNNGGVSAYERGPRTEAQKKIFGDERSLADIFALYIVSTLEVELADGTKREVVIPLPYTLRKTQDEVLDSGLITSVLNEIGEGKFSDPYQLLRSFKIRDIDMEKIKSAKILSQEPDAFVVQRTYRRPAFQLLKDLLDDGYPLDVPEAPPPVVIEPAKKEVVASLAPIAKAGTPDALTVVVEDYGSQSPGTEFALKIPQLKSSEIVQRASIIDSTQGLWNWIGKIGQDVVIEYEREKLIRAGREDLAKQVKDVSKQTSLGYDIESFSVDGEPIKIEVKSTITERPAFPMSANEISMAEKFGDRYYIYRVYLDFSPAFGKVPDDPRIVMVTVKDPFKRKTAGQIRFLPKEVFEKENSNDLWVKNYWVVLYQLGLPYVNGKRGVLN